MATAQDKLIKLYEQAQQRLVEIITRKVKRGSTAVYERQILKQIDKEIKKLKKATPELAQQLVLAGYKTGLESAVDDLLRQGIEIPSAYNMMSRLHKDAINLIVNNMVDDLTKAVNLVGRRIEDTIRQAGLDAAAGKFAAGYTIKDMQRDLIRRLFGTPDVRQPDGRIGVKYRNGKVVSLDTYARMVSRSTTAEAQNKSKFVQADAWGYDLVQCSKHYPTCEVCAKYQDRVYALTREAANGKYKGPDGKPIYFPYLYDTALVSGYETIHPNCRHRFVVFVPSAYTKEELVDIARRSSQPFDDLRSDEERKAYAKEQAVNRARSRDRREWRQLRAALPDDAPATLSGYRSMRRAKSRRYQELKAKYRALNDPDYVDILERQFEGLQNSANIKERIDKELSVLPANHRKLIDDTVKQIILTDTKPSGYNPRLCILRINRSYSDGDMIHETAHVIEAALDIYNDPTYRALMQSRFNNISINDIIYDDKMFSRPIYRLIDDRLISIYQGRMYEAEGILIDGKINIFSLRDYFAEGYRMYFIDPDKLKRYDNALYQYIKELL